jgi:oxaloacetate decarboxylase alpha subunit
VEAFVKKAVAYGMDIFRIFDALNDTRNMAKAMEVTKKEGAHVQATICYTLSPVHNIEYFVTMGRQLVEMGADSLAIKDMAGMLAPYDAHELVSRLKELGVPIQLHCHYTGGMASMSYLKAVEAGVDVLDTASSPLAMGTSQPPTESVVATLKGTPRDTGLDLVLLSDIGEKVKEIRKHYHIPLDIALGVDTNVLNYQIPGGMMSNLVSQLAQQKATHLLPEVLKEVPRVREDLGYPPLVTPTSQIVGSQAVVNVLLGERYKMISTEVKNYVRGMYGRPPAQLDKELQKKVMGEEEPVDIRPADLLEPQMELLACDLAESDDDLLSFALLPQVAETFFKRRKGLEERIPDEEKGGFPAEAKKKPPQEQKRETDFAKLHTVDDALLHDEEEDLLAYPAV